MKRDDDAKRIVLRRRAHFMSAALLGITSCASPEKPTTTPSHRDDIVIPPIPASARKQDNVPPALTPNPPDGDKDGIADADDACPDEPGVSDANPAKNGCPPAAAVARVCLSIVAPPTSVHFPTNGSKLPPEGAHTLDQASQLLVIDPGIKIEVEGHVDSTEPQSLGQARADAVKAELVRRGVDASRITTTNAGSTKPLVPNTTAEFRSRNRRIELHVR